MSIFQRSQRINDGRLMTDDGRALNIAGESVNQRNAPYIISFSTVPVKFAPIRWVNLEC